MKKYTVLLLTFLSAQFLMASNLLQNGEFNDPSLYKEMKVISNRGKFKTELYTEDRTWNKCVRMEAVKYRIYKGAKQLHGSLLFGKNGDYHGFPVEENTAYDYSFDLKGNVAISMRAYMYDRQVPYKQRKRIPEVRPVPINARSTPDTWTRVKGSFKTTPGAKYATFAIQIWADGRQQKVIPELGAYFMIDNLVISKKKTLLAAAPEAAATAPAAVRPTLTMPYQNSVTFTPKNPALTPIKLPVEISGTPQSITIAALLPPAGDKLIPVTENGHDLWETDDVLDVFFAPVKNDRAYSQFAVSSGGGRYHGNGKPVGKFDQWSGKAVKAANGQRKLIITIPWTMLGFDAQPAAGRSLAFNIGIKFNRQSYSFSPIKLGFNDLPNFGNIIFGSVGQYKTLMSKELQKTAPESMQNAVKKFAAASEPDPAQVIAQVQTLQRQIKSAQLGNAPFLTARLPLSGTFMAPLEVTAEQLLNTPVKLQGALNEKINLPLAIVNRTDSTAAYRVIVHNDASSSRHIENLSLSNNFPIKNIIYREIVPVKDSEGKNPGMIFDPLPQMNEAQTLIVPPRSTGAVWLEFDCNNVPAGLYKGFIRIIPLMEPAKFARRGKSQTAIQDHPISVKVLPITLPPPIDLAMFQQSINQNYVNKSCELGNPRLLLSAYAFKFKYDQAGNIVDSSAPLADALIKELKNYFTHAPKWVKPRYMIGYSFYSTFKKINLPKSIKPLTPAWEKCWRNHVKAIMDICRKHKLDKEMLYAEVVDEPHGEFFDEYLAATRIAHETAPDLRLTMTWGTVKFGITPALAARFDPYLNEQMYWWGLLNDPEFMRQRANFRKRPGVTTAIYECSTSIRENLHSYFRMHPWRARTNDFDAMGFYVWTNGLFNIHTAADWRTVLTGALTYRSGENCIPSVRMYVLGEGVTDMRYLDAVKKLKNRPDAEKFLKEYPAKVMRLSHDAALPGKFRKEAAKILLKK